MIMTSNLQNQLSKTTLIVCQCTKFQINENKWIHNILYAVYKLLQCMLRFVCKTGHSSLLVICVFYLHFYFSYSNLLKTVQSIFCGEKTVQSIFCGGKTVQSIFCGEENVQSIFCGVKTVQSIFCVWKTVQSIFCVCFMFVTC